MLTTISPSLMEAQNPSLGLGWVWGITYLHPAVLAHCALESRLLALLARPEQSREGSWLPAACPLTGSFAGQCCVVAPQLPMAQEPSWGTWPAFVPPPRHPGPVRFSSQSKPSLWPLHLSALPRRGGWGEARGLSTVRGRLPGTATRHYSPWTQS